MGCRSYPSVLVLALGMGLAGGMPDAWSQIVDLGKYPDFTGRWNRSEVYQWARGEKPPLTPEYQAIYETNIGRSGQRRTGCRRHVSLLPAGDAAADACLCAHGDRHHSQDHLHPDRSHPRRSPHLHRRARLAGPRKRSSRCSPATRSANGSTRTATANTTCSRSRLACSRVPARLDGLLPTHRDNQSVVKERIYLDKANPDILHDEITLIDHAYTRPWTITKNYPRYKKSRSDLVARGGLRGEQRARQHRQGKLLSELRRLSDAGQKEPDAARFAVLQTGRTIAALTHPDAPPAIQIGGLARARLPGRLGTPANSCAYDRQWRPRARAAGARRLPPVNPLTIL